MAGDARDYDTYSEESRVKDQALDSSAFPNAEALQAEERLGRLTAPTFAGYTNHRDFEADAESAAALDLGAERASRPVEGRGTNGSRAPRRVDPLTPT